MKITYADIKAQERAARIEQLTARYDEAIRDDQDLQRMCEHERETVLRVVREFGGGWLRPSQIADLWGGYSDSMYADWIMADGREPFRCFADWLMGRALRAQGCDR